MSVSLHTATVGTFLQILPSIAGLIDKAEAHCQAGGHADEALTAARLAEDMWPFAKQVSECAHHSARAIASVRSGVAGPEPGSVPTDFAWLRKEVADAIALLEQVDPAELESLAGGDVVFKFGERRMDFTAEDFLQSFSLPNFFFHATSAYAVLRNQGLPVGKMDFLGRLRKKP